MSWTNTPTGTALGHTKKADYDLIFDNQQRLKDEFDQQHRFSTSATQGEHHGFSQASTSSSQSSGVGYTTLLTIPVAAMDSGIVVVMIHAWQSSASTIIGKVLLGREFSLPKDIALYIYNRIVGDPTPDYLNQSNAGLRDSEPSTGTEPWFRIWVLSGNIEIALNTSLCTTTTYYFLTYHYLFAYDD